MLSSLVGESFILGRRLFLLSGRPSSVRAATERVRTARTKARRAYPCFLALFVSLEDMEALGALVIILLQTIHRSFGCGLAGAKGGQHSIVAGPGSSELTLRLLCKPPWPAHLRSDQIRTHLVVTHLKLRLIRFGFGCGGGLGHGCWGKARERITMVT